MNASQDSPRPGRPRRLLGLLVLLASFAAAWYWMDYRSFLQTPLRIPPGGLVYEVPAGASLKGIAADLGRRGLLEHPGYLYWHARLHGQGRRLRAGEYRLEPGLTPDALLALFIAGRTLSHRLTLLEGWDFRQVRAALEMDPVLEHRTRGMDDATLMARLGHPGQHPEGRFFPDTYLFPRGTTDLEFLGRAYARMQQVLAREWEARADGLPLASPYEALILASIVEKETGLGEERAQIAGVFLRRLRKGMRLQTDPTVIYGMGEAFDGNIRRSDLRADTPYNTYTRKGLPPTPICMPGAAAIHAVLHPAPGEALYFVARGDGSHVFSRTLEEHNAAVRRYQLGRGS